ncbi:MAG: hypothetical protein ACK5CY_08045 [Bacteroidia bacterium]|jgi:hypothetical protein
MKSLKFKTAILIFSLPFLFGCSGQPEDIKISELTSVCDYTGALLKVCHKINDIAKGRKPEDLSAEEKEFVITLNKKFKDIDRAMGKKFTLTEAKECDEFKELETLLDGAVDPFI